MIAYTTSDEGTLRYEIAASHDHCRCYGIEPMDCRHSRQAHLSPQEPSDPLDDKRRLLKVVTQQIQARQPVVAGAGFTVALAGAAVCLPGHEQEALVNATAQ